METSRVLFIGGSIGLGHAGRDVAIARALRALNPSVEISWLAGDPARRLIADAGETLLPDPVADETASAEGIAGHFALNVAQYAWRERSAWTQNVATFKQLTDRYPFDPVVGDETYELLGAFAKHPTLKRSPFTMIYDFVGLDSASRNPLERLLVHAVNRSWCRGGKPPVEDLALMIGQPDDREQQAHRVQARASGIVGLGHQQAMPISPTATMGNVDHEYRTPPEPRLQQATSNQRAKRQGDPACGGPDGDCPAALLLVETLVMIDSVAGSTAAAPAPMMARHATRVPAEPA